MNFMTLPSGGPFSLFLLW